MSIIEIKEWIEVNKKLITLGALFFLISSISFALGYLSAGELKHPQIVIEQNIPTQQIIAEASIIGQVKPVKKEPVALAPAPQVVPTTPPQQVSIVSPVSEQVSIPTPSPASVPVSEPVATPAATPVQPEPVQPTPIPVPVAQPQSTCGADQVNINTASKEQLDIITHVGPAIADRIIAARPFKSLQELDTKVSGIGPKYMADIIAQGKACVL